MYQNHYRDIWRGERPLHRKMAHQKSLVRLLQHTYIIQLLVYSSERLLNMYIWSTVLKCMLYTFTMAGICPRKISRKKHS